MKEKNILVAALSSLVLLSACAERDKQDTDLETEEIKAIAVETMIVQEAPLLEYVKVNGGVNPVSSVSLYPDVAGKIASIRVSAGDSVRRGQVLLTIDPSRPGANFQVNPVTAAINGTVIDIPLKIGETVSPQTPVATVGILNQVEITVYLAERYSALVKNGAPAELSFIAYPDDIFPASVVEISPVLDASTRALKVRLAPDRHDARIKVGMYAEVRLILREMQTLAVPSTAIIVRNDTPLLFLVSSEGENNLAEKREVSTGIISDGMTEIITGLTAGEEVIITGQTLVSTGSLISRGSSPESRIEGDNP